MNPLTTIPSHAPQLPRLSLLPHLPHIFPKRRPYTRPTFAPKPYLNLPHLRQNPGLYEQNALDRNTPASARNAWKILELHERLAVKQKEVLEVRRRGRGIEREVARQAGMGDDGQGPGRGGVAALVEEARVLKEELRSFERWEVETRGVMEGLAWEVGNLSSEETPVGDVAKVIGFVNGEEPPEVERLRGGAGRSHVEIGKELDILDFEGSAVTSGWGWYFLRNEGALLEQALVQYALDMSMKRGWQVMTPPSLVYEHIASACGFMPRDQNGETQRYGIADSDDKENEARDKASLVLAGTAEIPFAGSQANKTLKASELPLKLIGPSRCYRAEAGARGVDTKGLYRVHEFTKVEMFAWTTPPYPPTPSVDATRFNTASSSSSPTNEPDQTEQTFTEMLSLQTHLLTTLGLHARILEMPTADLGASAARKVDIEAFFPSRKALNGGYGEVTSASICTDYQTRRLGTRLRDDLTGGSAGGTKLGFPHTVNGTAMAVPRVLACLLENGWDEETGTVVVPEALRGYLLGGLERIGPKGKKKKKGRG